MKVILADPAGFCFGVSRAIELAEEKSAEGKLFSLGKIIHNSDEIKRLEKLGMQGIDDIEEIQEGGRVLIRSHGEAKAVYEALAERHAEIIDATCPFVSKLQKTIENYSEQDYNILLLGNPKHPEIIGAVGWSRREVTVIPDMEALRFVKLDEKPTLLVAQTTLPLSFWEEALAYLDEKLQNLIAINTICSATRNRQQAAAELAAKVDAMVIIGGKDSSNTQKLVDICKKINPNVYAIENSANLVSKEFEKYDIVGVSAGASTPEWIIQDVVQALNQER